ncbi:MAG: hypothetical protein ACRDVE_12720 [Actinocrinis sp.]
MTGVTLWTLRLLTAAGLAVDAYIHADLAATYDPVRHSISQGDLFRAEAGASALAALLVLLTARRAVWAFAFLVAASALGGILLYRYANVGNLGPLPNMYEPLWFPEKTATAIAEAAATVTALAGFATAHAAAAHARPLRALQHPEAY